MFWWLMYLGQVYFTNPKSRWDDNVKQDICKMKKKNWTVCIQDCGKWRDVIEKAKTSNI
jgi:hypothetical protein